MKCVESALPACHVPTPPGPPPQHVVLSLCRDNDSVDLSTTIMRVILFHIIKSCPRVSTQQGVKMKNVNVNVYGYTIRVYLIRIIIHGNNVESCGESSSAAYTEIKKGNRYPYGYKYYYKRG